MGLSSQVTLKDIEQAAAAIAGQVMRTPMRQSRTLSAIAGCEVWLKFENLQFTASFKERGALNKLLSLSEAERAGLADESATVGLDLDVEFLQRIDRLQRLQGERLHGRGGEVVLEIAPVHFELALAGHELDAGDGRFAASRAKKFFEV